MRVACTNNKLDDKRLHGAINNKIFSYKKLQKRHRHIQYMLSNYGSFRVYSL